MSDLPILSEAHGGHGLGPPRGLTLAGLASGEQALVYLPAGVVEKPLLTRSLAALVLSPAASGLANPDRWEDLLAAAGRGADVFVVDRRGERWRVLEVVFDHGGETGQLRLRHLGRRSRRGDFLVDLEQAYGHMLPVVVYRSR